jgi:hypothetical protein
MADQPTNRIIKTTASLNRQVNRGGILLVALMAGCALLAIFHHPAQESSQLIPGTKLSAKDPLVTVPTTVRTILLPQGEAVYGERMTLKLKIEAAGGLEHLMSHCALAPVAVGNVSDWASANADQGLVLGTLTAEDLKVWYDLGKTTVAAAMPQPSQHACDQLRLELGQTGSVRYLETRAIHGALAQWKKHPPALRHEPVMPAESAPAAAPDATPKD